MQVPTCWGQILNTKTMIQERAILHFNKYKALKNEFVQDTMKGAAIQILKVKLIRESEHEYTVKITVKSEIGDQVFEVDSIYATQHFKEIKV